MNFQQLRIVRETVRCNFNLTEVASVLLTSQSGVSKHIKDLEDEIGVELYVRKGRRLLGLTEPGKELIGIVERMLLDTGNIMSLADRFNNSQSGRLTIATTHAQARYALPEVVKQFKQDFPRVHLVLHQVSPKEIVSMLLGGEADIGIATEVLSEVPTLVSFPYYCWRHTVIVPEGHPLLAVSPLTLEAVAAYPVVTYHEGFTGRNRVDQAFSEAGLEPDIVMSAMDADVIKTYVELGLGIGIIAQMAQDEERDSRLRFLEAQHLFASNTTHIATRKGHYMRSFAFRFMELCSPELSEVRLRSAMLPDEVDEQ